MQLMRRVAGLLTPERSAIALELARLFQTVRGYGHVKEENLKAARIRQARLLQDLETSTSEERERAVASTAH